MMALCLVSPDDLAVDLPQPARDVHALGDRVRELWIARHGETEWTVSHRHTSVTDLDITPRGEREAGALGKRLSSFRFDVVLSSPALRARRTAELAGFGDRLVFDDDLREFHYGAYEGLTTDEVLRERPSWNLWTDGCPGGETVDEVAARADRVLARVESIEGSVLTIGHGHMSRVLAARFLERRGEDGSLLMLGPATLSQLRFDHGRPAIGLWNDACHLDGIV
jgi:broad specificity phosphatase PhoE